MNAARTTLLFLLALGPDLAAPAGDPDALMAAGHWKRARTIVEAQLKAHPDDPRTLARWSAVQLAFGNAREALVFAEKAVARDGRNPDYHLRVMDAAGTLADQGSVFKQLGLVRRTKKAMDAALALSPDSAEALSAMAMYYHFLPGLLGGDKAKARTAIDRIAKLDPGAAYLVRAALLDPQKETAEIARLYRQAIGSTPRHYEAYAALAGLHLGQKRYPEAESVARSALDANDDRIQGYSVLAAVYAAQGHDRDLEAILVEAERRIPDDLTPCFEAARLLRAHGRDLARAEALLNKYLAQEPEGYAASYAEPGVPVPTHAEARRQLALLLQKSGRKREALEQMEEALRLNPNLPDGDRDLRQIQR